MDQLGDKLKNLSGEIKHYIETRMEIFLIEISENLTEWAAQSIQKGLGILLLSSGFVFALAALAIYLGEILDSISMGFLIVSAPLLLIGLIFTITGSKFLSKSIQQQFMKSVLKSLEENESKSQNETKLLPDTTKKNTVEEKKNG